MDVSQTETYHRLNYKALQVGDVIIEMGESKFGNTIRLVEGKPFTHALLCISAGQVVEAVLRGVVFLSAGRIVTREPGRYRQLRCPGLTDLQKGAIEGAVRSQAFKNYNILGALGTKAAAIRPSRTGDAFFCSELVTTAYSAAGIVLVPGRDAASVTPNMFVGGTSVLQDVTSADLFEEIPVLGEDDRQAVAAMLDRDENIKGTEVDENRQTEQDMVRAYAAEFEAGYNYPDGNRRRLRNLAEMLRALTEMTPEDGASLSDRLTASLQSAGYFEIFTRTVSKSHIPTWTMDMAELWCSGRQAEAMALVDRAYEVAVLYRTTAERLRADAAVITPGLASRLSVLRAYKEMFERNAATLENYCEQAENYKRLRDLTFGNSAISD